MADSPVEEGAGGNPSLGLAEPVAGAFFKGYG